MVWRFTDTGLDIRLLQVGRSDALMRCIATKAIFALQIVGTSGVRWRSAAGEAGLITRDLLPSSLCHVISVLVHVGTTPMAGRKAGSASPGTDEISGTPKQAIDAKIAALGDWRGAMLALIRSLIRQADPEVVEDVKWRKPSNPLGVPVWSHGGILCTGETYKDKVKLTFAQGALLPDPSGLFNAGLDGGTRRAIDLRDSDVIDEAAFRALVASAGGFNTGRR